MNKPRLILLGGFLGSGKTTLMVDLGRRLRDAGHTVGVITNDQGELLVDTRFASAAGLATGEVLNGCFCCNLSTFVANVGRIVRDVAPDYIIAEPVGSCTDLVATVLSPLSLYHRGLLELAAYLVLADGPRLVGEYQGLNLKAPITPREVLVAHQIAEADHLVLSKIDLLSKEDADKAEKYLRSLNSRARITRCSATVGTGMDEIVVAATSGATVRVPQAVDIDYETYAAAEAEMGWYNGRAEVIAVGEDFDPEALAFDLAMRADEDLGESVIHGKVLVTTDTGSIKVSIVGGVLQADVAREGDAAVGRAALTVNLRATRPPEELAAAASAIIHAAVDGVARIAKYDHQALIPGAPVPEHRITTLPPT